MPAHSTEGSRKRSPRAARPRTGGPWAVLLLVLIAGGLYLPNIDDYFLADDFDLIQSFYGKPFSYFPALLYHNESGAVWTDLGMDEDSGLGFLRPVKIWVLALELGVWGTRSFGFHLTATAFFVGIVLMVRRILVRFLPDRPELALLGAAMVAIHPLFSEVVPYITASEELISIFFGLAAFHAFLAHRMEARSPWTFYVLFVLSLLTKESGITVLGLAVGYDLVGGRVLTRSRSKLAATARLYAPFVAILAGYFSLRLLAFGNLEGGDVWATGYLERWVFLRFHRLFYRALVDPTMLSIGGYRWAGAGLAIAGSAALALVALRGRRIDSERWRDLLFLGPVWYVMSTAVLYGAHFALRRNGLPLIGMVTFLTVALASALGPVSRRRRVTAAAVTLALAAALWIPPALRNSHEFHRASRIVREARAEIEARTADLPAGCVVGLANVPQSIVAPWYFGWGLLSALKQPFTATDLARRCTVYDPRNRALNRVREPPPAKFDRVIEFEPGRWRSEEDLEREVGRLVRIGLLRRVGGTVVPVTRGD